METAPAHSAIVVQRNVSMSTTNESSVPVAIYARFSTERQDARSIDDQVRRCRVLADARGYHVADVYSDAAISGSHVERAGMQRLLAAARMNRSAPFRAVLVDDLSRLSRDLGDTWQIVFRDLASVDVRVIDVTTGLASDGAGARLTFGALALVNDTFLQLVRAETHRGLEGRALGGFWTGGRCYGFTSVHEENPPDPEHPRKLMVVNPDEAATVLRVFRSFAEGISLKRIASALNEEGLVAPNDGGPRGRRGNKNGHGWGHTTLRAMIQNERYIGCFNWNQSKWVRVPGRKSRRRVVRPRSEWVTHEYPELAIVPRDLWDAANARLRRTTKHSAGRPAGSGKHGGSLLSGMLRCGTCGGSMVVVSRKTKAGVSYGRYGCTAHNSRGPAICANSMRMSEKKVTRAVVSALKEKLDRQDLVARFVDSFRKRTVALQKRGGGPGQELEVCMRECAGRIANLADSLARVGWSEALATKLREEEALLARLKTERTAAAKREQPRVIPHPSVVAAYLKSLFTMLEADTTRGREILSRFVSPIVMTPEVENDTRGYRVTGAFNMSFLLIAAAGGGTRGAGGSGTGGKGAATMDGRETADNFGGDNGGCRPAQQGARYRPPWSPGEGAGVCVIRTSGRISLRAT